MGNTINQASPTTVPVGLDPSIYASDPPGLDMDSMMELVKEKYGVLTSEFQDQMKGEQTRQATLRSVLDAKQDLGALGTKDIYGGTPDSADAQKRLLAADAAIPDTPETHELKARLEWCAQQLKNKDALPDGDRSKQPLAADEINKTLSMFDTAQNAMNTDAQTNMLQMQDLMGKIQTLMSMASNVQSDVHDMQKGLVANLRD